MLPGYHISWEGVALEKPAVLEMSLAEESRGTRPEGTLALYVLAEGENWRRLGGTSASYGRRISAAIECEGTYAVYRDAGGPASGGGLSAVTFTPRVLSPSGSFASAEVAVSFTLGRPGPVTVKIYNRAGRLVKELASELRMNAGANITRWDGRDSGGAQVPDGLTWSLWKRWERSRQALSRSSGDNSRVGGPGLCPQIRSLLRFFPQSGVRNTSTVGRVLHIWAVIAP